MSASLRTSVFQSTRPGWGEACIGRSSPRQHGGFQSTRPGWGEAKLLAEMGGLNVYFNPLAPGGARLHLAAVNGGGKGISIHSPRVGRGAPGHGQAVCVGDISIHSPRVGRGA